MSKDPSMKNATSTYSNREIGDLEELTCDSEIEAELTLSIKANKK